MTLEHKMIQLVPQDKVDALLAKIEALKAELAALRVHSAPEPAEKD